jgi:hypothetical protein
MGAFDAPGLLREVAIESSEEYFSFILHVRCVSGIYLPIERQSCFFSWIRLSTCIDDNVVGLIHEIAAWSFRETAG